MNYEEYAERMKKQKREPVEREHYEEIVEKAYMALLDVDKDEFCALSDKVVACIRALAVRAEKAERNARLAVEKLGAFEEQLDRTAHELDETKKQLDAAESDLRARNELLETLVADMAPRDIVMALLNR